MANDPNSICDAGFNFNTCTSKYVTESELDNLLKAGSESTINLIHINSRSLQNFFSSITNLLSKTNCKFTAIGLTETWLSPVSPDIFHIEGYKFVCKSRMDKTGGGVGLFIDSAYTSQIRDDLSFMKDNIESIFIEIMQKILQIS